MPKPGTFTKTEADSDSEEDVDLLSGALSSYYGAPDGHSHGDEDDADADDGESLVDLL